MSFFGKVVNELKNQTEKIKQTKEKLEGKNSEQLHKIVNSSWSNSMDQQIARKILSDRGDL